LGQASDGGNHILAREKSGREGICRKLAERGGPGPIPFQKYLGGADPGHQGLIFRKEAAQILYEGEGIGNYHLIYL